MSMLYKLLNVSDDIRKESKQEKKIIKNMLSIVPWG